MAITTVSVSAHGVHGAERQVFVGPAGPFDVRVRSTTAIGEVHVTVFVIESATGAQVPDATVFVAIQDADQERPLVGPEPASSIISGSNAYAATLLVEEPGAQALTGEVTSETVAGQGMFEVLVPITGPASQINWGLILVLLALVAFALWPVQKKRRQQGRGS